MTNNIDSLSFSSLFYIIYSNISPGKYNKLQCFTAMMEWAGLSIPSHQRLSPWINGNRKLPEDYADVLLQDGYYAKMYECISNNVLPYLIDIQETLNSIVLLMEADNTISKDKLKFFFSYLSDPAHFISDVLFYTITQNLNKPINTNVSYKPINLVTLCSNSGLPKSRIDVLGRKAECKIISTILKRSSIIFLYGIPGIGKSELAKHYIRINKSRFENVIYVPFSASIKESIANLHFIDDEEDASSEDKYKNHLNHLHSYDENTIVLLDNFNIAPEDDVDFYTLANCQFQLIITTRNKPIDYPAFQIKELQKKACINLFRKHGPTDLCDTQIEDILDRIYKHTLLIVMIAKTLKYTELSYEDVVSSLSASIIDTPTTTSIPITKDNQTLLIIYKQFILNLIKLSHIAYNELDLLCTLALLPIDGVPCKFLISYTESNTFNDVNKLLHLGYLNCDDSSDRILTIHPLIGEIALEECHENIPRIVKSLLSNFFSSVYRDKYYPNIQEQRIAISIFQHISSFVEYNFCNEVIDLTSFFMKSGQYALVKHTTNYIQDNSSILNETELPYIRALAEYYQGIADVQLENNDTAIFHFEQSANYLADLSDFSTAEAELYFNSLIEAASCVTNAYISIENLSNIHVKKGCLPERNFQVLLGRLYFKFAEKYLLINEFDNAKEKFGECIEIRRQILGADSTGVGLAYANIGFLFQQQKDYTTAVNYYERALKILNKYLPQNHINIIKLHTNLGIAYLCNDTLPNNVSLSNMHFEIARSNAELLLLDNKDNSNQCGSFSLSPWDTLIQDLMNNDCATSHSWSHHNEDNNFDDIFSRYFYIEIDNKDT